MSTGEGTLEACYAAGRSGTFSISEHAHSRVRALGHSPADVRHALTHATRCERAGRADGDDRQWTVHGPSLDGSEITLNVVLTAGSLSVV
jgi:hypothetical protein